MGISFCQTGAGGHSSMTSTQILDAALQPFHAESRRTKVAGMFVSRRKPKHGAPERVNSRCGRGLGPLLTAVVPKRRVRTGTSVPAKGHPRRRAEPEGGGGTGAGPQPVGPAQAAGHLPDAVREPAMEDPGGGRPEEGPPDLGDRRGRDAARPPPGRRRLGRGQRIGARQDKAQAAQTVGQTQQDDKAVTVSNAASAASRRAACMCSAGAKGSKPRWRIAMARCADRVAPLTA